MSKKRLIHIHVGKCAGTSINMVLNKNKIPFEQLHCNDADISLKKLLSENDDRNIYLISARDPIKRFVSAFNWDKYEKIICAKRENSLWNKIYQEFSSVNDLVEAFLKDDKDRKNLAEVACKSSKLHINLGLSWYIPISVVSLLPRSRTYLVRTESFYDDLAYFLSIEYKVELNKDLPKDKDSSSFLMKVNIDNPKYLSAKSVSFLKQNLLAEDYFVYDYLQKYTVTRSKDKVDVNG